MRPLDTISRPRVAGLVQIETDRKYLMQLGADVVKMKSFQLKCLQFALKRPAISSATQRAVDG